MRITGRNLRRRLSGPVSKLKNRLSRARYFRGHGVHSPFVYDIVRHVFMRNTLLPGDRSVYTELIARGIPARRAVQLQNLCIHCSYDTCGLNRADAELCVVTRDLPSDEALTIIRVAAARGATVAVMAPYEGRERQDFCRRIVAEHSCTTVDNCGYLLLFNNYLPKQYFRI